MLKLFRQRKLVVRVFLFGIVAVVGFMMVVTLVPGLGGGSMGPSDQPGVLAQVGEEAVTAIEVQREYQRRVEQLGTQSPVFRQLMLESVVDDLILQRVVEYEAERLGLQVTPGEVSARLRQFSLFFPAGEFVGADTYQRIVQQQFRMSVPEFEDQVRRQTLLGKLFWWITSGVTVSDAEVEQEYRRRHDRVQIEIALVRPEKLTRGLKPSEEELRGYYESNRERYQLPERRAVRFVPVDYDILRQRLRVTDEEFEAYYESHRQDYRLPEQVRARHILFLRRSAGASESGETDPAREEANAVLEKLRKGGDFTALAREHSEHEASRENDGEMGWVQRGQTEPALEEALFSMAPGSPPELVATSYGYHIVQVLEHRPARLKSLAEVKGEIETILKERKVQEQAWEQARSIVEAARGGETLEAAAAQAGWPVRETRLFARTETLPAFGNDVEFQEAAFRLPAESAGQPQAPVSEPVVVPSGYAVLQLKEVSPGHTASFEEVREQVARTYRQERAAEMAREAAERLAREAAERGELRGPARRAGLPIQLTEKFGRDGSLPGLGPVREIAPVAFNLGVGEVSPAVPVGGNWAVFRVLAREDADLNQLTPEEKKNIRRNLLESKRELTWTIFTESLKKRLLAEGKLTLNQPAIERLTRQS